MRVPSVLDELVCVAGVDAKKYEPWARSSRGPSATYARTSSSTPEAPRMAHRVDLPSLAGTSSASPRAAADAAHLLITHSGLKPTDLVTQLLGSNYTPAWDSCIGYGSNT